VCRGSGGRGVVRNLLENRRRHSSVLDVLSFRAADCDNLVVAKVRERLAVNKQRTHRFLMGRFNLKKLNKVVSGQHIVIVTTIWWWRKLGRD
jgi:hypothetical protein